MASHVSSRSGPRSVWLLTGGLGVLAAGLQLTLVARLDAPPHDVSVPFWALALGFFLVEACVTHVKLRDQTHSFSLSEIPLVFGLFLVDPELLVAARLLGGGLALVLVRRQRLQKAALNLAQWWLATVIAIALWHAIAADADASVVRTWAATAVAVAVAELLTTLVIVAAIRLQDDRTPGVVARGAQAEVVALVHASFALVALDVVLADWRNVWAVLVVGAALFVANGTLLRLYHRHVALERLNVFTTDVARHSALDALVADIVSETRRLLGAQTATMDLSPELSHAAGLGSRLMCDADGVRATDDAGAAASSADRQDGRTLSVVLQGGCGVLGTLSVHERLGDVGGFTRDDAGLLRAVGHHAGERLCNILLTQRLQRHAEQSEHQALHDPLTGLPNRVLFSRWVTEGCGASDCAVLLLDLDRFKEVNDTLGHASGDELLREVARRLRLAAREGDCVARLGGDEFAMLLRATDERQARERADEVRALLVRPVKMAAMSLTVQASIGVAVSPQHGNDPATLLRKADVAMYVAKRTRAGTEVYSPGCDENTALRLALVSDLRRSLLENRFHLLYQPKARVSDGGITGFEALIRWNDPRRGLVTPDLFIPVAEQVGLIGEITEWVVREALAQCGTWQSADTSVDVAVNVSPPTLHDPGFVSLIRRLLHESGVAPQRLTLEITEGAVMRDPVHAMRVLQQLRDLGVRLSIDDLGAGQSSLTYLRRLPVDEVKIDKSFVMGMSDAADDDAIVTALVNLVHTLRLPVVAEGVEDARTWARLRDIGCDTAQGYFLARPLTAERVPQWLAEWELRIELPETAFLVPTTFVEPRRG